MLLSCDPPTYGRSAAGVRTTAATHQPAATRTDTPIRKTCHTRRRTARRRREQVDDGHDRKDQEGLHHLGDEAEAHQRPGQDEPLGLRPLQAAHGGVQGAREQQGQHRVGVVVTEHQGGHRA